jgi:hypothetical protein
MPILALEKFTKTRRTTSKPKNIIKNILSSLLMIFMVSKTLVVFTLCNKSIHRLRKNAKDGLTYNLITLIAMNV